MLKINIIVKLGTIVIRREYRDAAHRICNLKCNVPKEIPIVFHNGPNYDYHFTIKVLVEEFERQ